MKWIVLGVGLATAVLGGWWTWFGLSIVQVERGWSAVIAGSVLVAAGLVIMAIAALMQRIDALSKILASSRLPASERAAAPVAATDAPARREPAPSFEQASVATPSAEAPSGREADILAAVGAALEFSPAVATDDASERARAPSAPEPSSSAAPGASPPRPPVVSAPPAAPVAKPAPSYARPGQDTGGPSAPPRRFAPAPMPAPAPKPVRSPLAEPALKHETKASADQPERFASGRLAASQQPAAPDAEKPKEASTASPRDVKKESAQDLPARPSIVPPADEKSAETPAPEPRIEHARADAETNDAPAIVAPAPPPREGQAPPMLGPVLSPQQEGAGPTRKPSSFGWLEKARQRDQLRARKAEENTSDAPPVLSPGAPALDEADLDDSAQSRAPAPAPEPALEAVKPPEADTPARDDADDAERDVPGALADAPITASGEGAGSRLVRRYDSQGVKYNLYEDGTIEAESESGMYRFGSLAELRAFLEKRA